MEKRSDYIDVIKGIGIISIVIGHICGDLLGFPIGPFVYSYHIMVFVFIAGFCMKEEHFQNPASYIGKNITKMFIYYFLYNLFFILLHNTLVNAGLIDAEIYTIRQFMYNIFGALAFRTNEKLLGAFWFIPMYLIAKCIFVMVQSWIQKTKYKKIMNWLTFIFFAYIGTYLSYNSIAINFFAEYSLLAIPFLYMGYYVKTKWKTFQKYVPALAVIPAFVLIWFLIPRLPGKIDYSMHQIIHPFIFYPFSLLGIYYCFALAKGISKLGWLNKTFAYIGKDSIHIMALHFLSFKIVDYVYFMNFRENTTHLALFPTSTGSYLFIIYFVVGLGLPLLLAFLFRTVKNKVLELDKCFNH